MLAEEYADPDTFLRVYPAAGPNVSAIRTRLSAATLKRMDLRHRLGTDPPSYHRPAEQCQGALDGRQPVT